MAAILNTLEPEVTLTSAGTAQQVSTTSIIVTGATITADESNSGNIVVGNSDVNTDNAKLLAAGQSIELAPPQYGGGSDQFDLRDVYFDGSSSSDVIKVVYWTRPEA